MFRCFSLDDKAAKPGIKPGSFESLVSDDWEGPVEYAELQWVPVAPVECGDTGPCMPFAIACDKGDVEPGAIVSYKGDIWSVCTDDSDVILLDACFETGKLLVFLPPSRRNLLYRDTCAISIGGVCPELPTRRLTLSTNEAGDIETAERSNGYLMLEALGVVVQKAEPARGCRKAGSKARKAPCSSPQQGAAAGRKTKSRTAR